MFRVSSAHPQEVNVINCTCMQPLVFSFSAGGRLVHLLRGDCLVYSVPDSYVFRSLDSCVVTVNSYFYVVWC